MSTTNQTQLRSAISNTVRSTILLFHSIPPGEVPPPPPNIFFGRDELIATTVGLAENLTQFALVGPPGIGKTSVALAVLHHNRIKSRFGDNRWFLRCDEVPASPARFLDRLSKVIGAGVENPKDLGSLQYFLSSREMIIVLDNVESILDRRGTNGPGIYGVVEELRNFNTVCLCLTSRSSFIPPCDSPEIPTLSMEAARDTFYSIYKNCEVSDSVNNVLQQLDLHPLSITLLATVACRNDWDINQLTKEWESQRTGLLRTERNGSLAASIELSLTSPMFRGLGPNAREVLEVIACFPQGIYQDSLDWLSFHTFYNIANIFDDLCSLSLTDRSNGLITMLAPFRDYFRPKDPTSSPLPYMNKRRLYVARNPDKFDPEEARWIALGKGNDLQACESCCLLGRMCYSKGEVKEAIKHFEIALRIASPLNWHTQLFWIHRPLAVLYLEDKRFDDAQAHVELARSYANDDPYLLGHVMWLQAGFWYNTDRTEEARSEACHAIDAFEQLRAAEDLVCCRYMLQCIEVRR